MAFYQLYRKQHLPASLEEVWEFISVPQNLKSITPEYMGFDITSGMRPGKMYAGMIISYKVRPLAGIRTNWVTEITHVQEGAYFVDEQRIGPYALWHHQHLLTPQPNGVLMEDIVTYQPPFGLLGALMNDLFIRQKLGEIFDYREKALVRIFGNS